MSIKPEKFDVNTLKPGELYVLDRFPLEEEKHIGEYFSQWIYRYLCIHPSPKPNTLFDLYEFRKLEARPLLDCIKLPSYFVEDHLSKFTVEQFIL